MPIGYTDLYRDGELIAHGIDPYEESYIDHNVPHGVHSYSIVNVYSDPNWWECPNKSCPKTIDVRPCYPPKNLEIDMEPLNDEWKVSRLTWNKEDALPQREDIRTFYEIYRKEESQNNYYIVGVLPKDETLESFEYYDTVPNGTYSYRVNDYNVYPSGSCQSEFAENTWSVEEFKDGLETCLLHPSPTTGLLTIAMDDFSHAEVYDLMGRKIKQSQRPTLDLHALPQGLYVVKVFDKTDNSIIRKIIKQ